MQKATKAIFNKLVFSGIILLFILLLQPLELFLFVKNIPVIFPSGLIALKERNLLLLIQVLMLLFIIPVYIFTFIFSWWYRAENDKSKYDPHLVDNKLAEVVWWGLPLVMTTIVAVITWYKTDELDPYKPLNADNKPVKVEVVALQWKWLFIYPEENIASVNYLQFPKDTPVEFEITADAPMNSFWIPALAGQIYAMPGMRTKLNLIANDYGTFRGSSANISGEGFAWMTFETQATTEEAYRDWIEKAKTGEKGLNRNSYQLLAAPSIDHPVELYRLEDPSLFHQIIMSFMKPKT